MPRAPRIAGRPTAARRALLALALLTLGCGDAPRAAREESTAADVARPAPPAAPSPATKRHDERGVAGGAAGDAAANGFVVAQSAPPPASPPAIARPPVAQPALDPAGAPMLIRTGHASVEVDSLEPAAAAVRALAARVGGYVAGSTLATGRDQVRSATLELKVPAGRFEQAIGGLAPLGRVETVDVTAQDVGEEYVDVAARVANARRLEARLLSLLERSAARLSDVLAVERELARVREEIERAEGRLRFLGTRVAVSTLTVTVHERAPLVGRVPSDEPLREALRQAWRNFVALLAFTIASLGVLLPLAVLAALLRRLWHRRRS